MPWPANGAWPLRGWTLLSTVTKTSLPRPASAVRTARPVGAADPAIGAILEKAVAGQRLSFDEGVHLLSSHDLHGLGRAADAVTRRLHPEPYRTYNIDRNINYTNVCAAVCDFCAFYR